MDSQLLQEFAASLCEREKGLEILDRNFPIREGHSRVDLIAGDAARNFIFIWKLNSCGSGAISKLLADYDWIQKNLELWLHLFPQSAAASPQMIPWIFAKQIDPEVRYFLKYLEGTQLQLYQFAQRDSDRSWSVSPWPENKPAVRTNRRERAAGLPESSGQLLTREEIDDLIRISPSAESHSTEETTESHYDL